ncbi:hypothetical protein F5050DRAFT_296734 [Lentinula boryana]|uniref:Uncharacterized protein n=1 Tax=Lentinula boryana TaxID=40481 RepID=A0ABQ8QAI0_9AGAR|nr:hypothetical protein F5050DRAFT_296734 [Lentinula boryana]
MSSKPNGTPASITDDNTHTQSESSSVHQDIPLIANLLSETHLDESNRELTEFDLAGLLKQIDGANGVLNGVEDKLDGVLNNLDSLLAALESAGDQSSSGGVTEDPATAPNDGDAKESKEIGEDNS